MLASLVSALTPVLPALAVSGCDIVTADCKAQETAEWRKTYELTPGGRVEISNVNGRIEVEPSDGNTVEVVAVKSARGRVARSGQGRRSSGSRFARSVQRRPIKVETKLPRGGRFMHMGGAEVSYTVRVPASAEVEFTTVNGGDRNAPGSTGASTPKRPTAASRRATSAGRSRRRRPTAASMSSSRRIADQRRRSSECTNGGIKLRLPADAKATISRQHHQRRHRCRRPATSDKSESTRRRLEARLNGGGPPISIDGTNGGIRIAQPLS